MEPRIGIQSVFWVLFFHYPPLPFQETSFPLKTTTVCLYSSVGAISLLIYIFFCCLFSMFFWHTLQYIYLFIYFDMFCYSLPPSILICFSIGGNPTLGVKDTKKVSIFQNYSSTIWKYVKVKKTPELSHQFKRERAEREAYNMMKEPSWIFLFVASILMMFLVSGQFV